MLAHRLVALAHRYHRALGQGLEKDLVPLRTRFQRERQYHGESQHHREMERPRRERRRLAEKSRPDDSALAGGTEPIGEHRDALTSLRTTSHLEGGTYRRRIEVYDAHVGPGVERLEGLVDALRVGPKQQDVQRDIRPARDHAKHIEAPQVRADQEDTPTALEVALHGLATVDDDIELLVGVRPEGKPIEDQVGERVDVAVDFAQARPPCVTAPGPFFF